ncbi:hypothetical protein IZQ21_001704 [Escherichia coli]|nr:hypothetical protein [Escherichia coli]
MLSTQFNRDNQYQAITKPSLLAGCIALALLPSAAFAAPATEETVLLRVQPQLQMMAKMITA